MGIRRQRSAPPDGGPPEQEEERGRVRLAGEERLVDVAMSLYNDDRLLPLLMDLNPALGHGDTQSQTRPRAVAVAAEDMRHWEVCKEKNDRVLRPLSPLLHISFVIQSTN